jgi:hypothetical protein
VATPAGQRRRRSAIAVGGRAELSPATLLFIVALCGAAFVLLLWQSDLSFWFDEWSFLLHRRGFSADAILAPHNEHIAVVPVLVYKAIQATLGMDSPRPYQAVATLAFLTTAVLLYAYMRRRVGGWLALAGVLPILFFGPSWIDLLWPFQIAFWGSLIGGIGALLLLERDEPRSDLLACLLLGVSMASSSLGIPFAIGVAILIATGGDPRRRAFVVVVPVALFALWWLGWGHDADNHLTFDNVLESPRYVVEGLASSLACLFGLCTQAVGMNVTVSAWRWPLLVVVLGLAVWRCYRIGWGSRWLWATVAIAASFWFLAAFNASIFREPESGRYQVVGAILILLVAAELLREVRVARWPLIAVLAVAVAAAASNLSILHRGWESFAAGFPTQRASLAALEISADTVRPEFTLSAENSNFDSFGIVDTGSYLSAVDAFGSPAYSTAELRTAPEDARVAADKALASALRIGLAPLADSRVDAGARCREVDLGAGPATLRLPVGGAVLRGSRRTDADLALRRYASASFPVALGTLSPGEVDALSIPPDRSTKPWVLALTGSGSVTVCDDR